MITNIATAVMDASIVYGASRWYRGVHNNPNWEYAGKYKPEDDHRLFHEFLHDILLYDRIIIDSSSVSSVANELKEFFTKINVYLNKELILWDKLTDLSYLEPIQQTTCEVIKCVIENGIKNENDLAKLHIPWAYHSSLHHDYKSFIKITNNIFFPNALVPLAIYAFRGICYSGFANGLSKSTNLPTVYLASPGRIKVLAQLLDARDIRDMRYPLVAYRDLVSALNLPKSGYTFNHIRTVDASQLSELTLAVATQEPRDSLKFVLRLRDSSESATMRNNWAERIWSRGKSASIGSEGSQTITNSTINGSVFMYQLHGVATDE